MPLVMDVCTRNIKKKCLFVSSWHLTLFHEKDARSNNTHIYLLNQTVHKKALLKTGIFSFLSIYFPWKAVFLNISSIYKLYLPTLKHLSKSLILDMLCVKIFKIFITFLIIPVKLLMLSIVTFFIKSSSYSITVSNNTCYCDLAFLLLVFIISLEWFNFSRFIESLYLINCFRFLLVSSLLLTGQFPSLSKLFVRISLSFFSVLHWNIRRFTVYVPCLHGYSGLPIIFNQCK